MIICPPGWNRGKVAAKIWLIRILKRPPAPYVSPGLNCHQTDIANDCDVAHCLMKNNAILVLNLQYALIKFYFYGFLFTFKVNVNKPMDHRHHALLL